MSFLEFLGITFIGLLVDEYVRYSMDETSIFSHKKSAATSDQAELHNHYKAQINFLCLNYKTEMRL